MKKCIIFLMCISMLSLTACNDVSGSGEVTTAPLVEDTTTSQTEGIQSPVFCVPDVLPEKLIQRAVSDGNFTDMNEKIREIENQNPVSDEFYKALEEFSSKTTSAVLSGAEGNTAYSPVSLYYVMSMLATGGEGKNEEELMNLLSMMDMGKEEMAKQSGNYMRNYSIQNDSKINNSIWFNSYERENRTYKMAFKDTVRNDYYASLFTRDFSDEKVDEEMNDWTYKNTDKKLNPDFDFRGSYSDLAMVIINTISYKTSWQDEFNKELNTERDFKLKDGTTVRTEFMNQTFPASVYGKGEGYIQFSMRTSDGGDMTFYLPDENTDVYSLFATTEKVSDLTSDEKDYIGAKVNFSVPKFAFKGAETNLIDSMKKLGVNEAFNSDNTGAFNGIFENSTMYISALKQGTYIGIDEKGLEAAAYTYAVGTDNAIILNPDNSEIDFVLDRPFAYSIKDTNGVVLFTGVVENPTDKG